jgi:hypothetical protein
MFVPTIRCGTMLLRNYSCLRFIKDASHCEMFTCCFFLHTVPTVYKSCENLFSESLILVNGVDELFPVLSSFPSDLFNIRQVRSTQQFVE